MLQACGFASLMMNLYPAGQPIVLRKHAPKEIANFKQRRKRSFGAKRSRTGKENAPKKNLQTLILNKCRKKQNVKKRSQIANNRGHKPFVDAAL